MSMTHPTPNRPSATVGNLPDVPGFERIGAVVTRVVEGLSITKRPAKFWFVWTKTGRVPRFAHDSFEAATAEAERLATIHPGKTFIVLEAVQKIAAAPVEDVAA